MATAEEEIKQFLARNHTTENRAFDVALLFATSMLMEMRSATGEWEAAVAALERKIEQRDAEHLARISALALN